MDPRAKIDSYFQQLGTTQLPVPLHLLTYTRELLEFSKKQGTFQIANLYANWAVHTQLTGSAAGYELLGRVNSEIIASFSTPVADAAPNSFDGVSGRVSQAMRTAELRAELQQIYGDEGIATPFLSTDAAWRQLLAGMISEIRGKPIRFPAGPASSWSSKTAQRVYNDAKALIAGTTVTHDKIVVEFLVESLPVPLGQPLPPEGTTYNTKLHWVIELEMGVKIISEVHMPDLWEP